MENLDEFMRHKFNSEEPDGRFEFREEYWDQAVALIELDEARRKKQRRRFLFWWISGLILVAGVWGFWQTGSELFHNNYHQDPAEHTVVSGSTATQSGMLNTASGNRANNVVSAQRQVSNTQHSSIVPASAPDKKEVVSNAHMGQSTIQATVEQQNGNVDKAIETPKNNGYVLLRKAEKAPEGTAIPTPVKDPGLSDSNSNDLSIASAGQTAQQQTILFDLLPLPFQPVGLNRKLQQPTGLAKPAIAQSTPVKIVKEKRFRAGVEMFGSNFIAGNNATYWGGGAGIFADYRLLKQWSVTGGFRYRYIPNVTVIQATAQEDYKSLVRYSFGAQYIEEKKDINGFHIIELPVGMQWNKGRWALSVYGAPGVVLGALGRVIATSQSSLSFAPAFTDSRNDIYFSSNAYRRFSISAGTAIEWQAFSGLALCAQFQYHGSLVKPTEDSAKPKGFESISIGVKYRF